MSDVAQTVLAGTRQMQDAYGGATLQRSRRRAIEREQARDAGASLGAALTEYGSWAKAKEVEDELAAVSNADALARTTGDPRHRLVTLGAVRVRNAAGATLRARLMDAAMKESADRDAFALDQAKHHLAVRAEDRARAESKARLEHWKEADAAARARREEPPAHPKVIEKFAADRGLDPAALYGATPSQLADYEGMFDPTKSLADIEAEAAARARGAASVKTPDTPSGLEAPMDPLVSDTLESKFGLSPGSLRGKPRSVKADLDVDVQREMLKALQIVAKTRENKDYQSRETRNLYDQWQDAARRAMSAESVPTGLDLNRVARAALVKERREAADRALAAYRKSADRDAAAAAAPAGATRPDAERSTKDLMEEFDSLTK